MTFIETDGGRAAAGRKGSGSDCVTRAIAIATGRSYQEVFDALTEGASQERLKKKRKSPASGVYRSTYERYLKMIGWEFVPTMAIGSGCKVHLKAEELPKGRIIARVSKHLVAVIDGAIYDNHDPSRGGTRCVYGYYRPTSDLYKVQWRAPGEGWRERNNPPRLMPRAQAIAEAWEAFEKNKGSGANDHEIQVIAAMGEDEPTQIGKCSLCAKMIETRSSVMPDFCGDSCVAPPEIDPAFVELFERAEMGMNAIPNALYQDAVKQVIAIARAAKENR